MRLTFDQERVPLSVWPDGSVRVDGGRLHLAIVITAWNMGQSPEEIAANFPPLDLATSIPSSATTSTAKRKWTSTCATGTSRGSNLPPTRKPSRPTRTTGSNYASAPSRG